MENYITLGFACFLTFGSIALLGYLLRKLIVKIGDKVYGMSASLAPILSSKVIKLKLKKFPLVTVNVIVTLFRGLGLSCNKAKPFHEIHKKHRKIAMKSVNQMLKKRQTQQGG